MSDQKIAGRQYRVRWRSWRREPGKDRLTSRLRYEHRESMEAADRLAESIIKRQEEDYCECRSDWTECEYCAGLALPPTDVLVFSRPVGAWENEPFAEQP